jgi:hypothetical protein
MHLQFLLTDVSLYGGGEVLPRTASVILVKYKLYGGEERMQLAAVDPTMMRHTSSPPTPSP